MTMKSSVGEGETRESPPATNNFNDLTGAVKVLRHALGTSFGLLLAESQFLFHDEPKLAFVLNRVSWFAIEGSEDGGDFTAMVFILGDGVADRKLGHECLLPTR
jgi:hypothetical protein